MDKTYYSKEGFEETFAVNHLSHFLLVNLLLDRMTKDGRIAFVSSGTHDPKKKAGMPEPVYKNEKILAYPEENYTNDKKGLAGRRRYTTSKLCNIYCMYELVDRLNQMSAKNITVNAFDPGLMPETGLARTYHPISRFVLKYFLGLFVIFPANINSVAKSGKTLASLVTDNQLKHVTGRYFEGKKEMKTSALSYNKENQKNLWNVSVELSQLQKDESVLL
ncbi:hypothetical protein [Oceanobacillus jeddahense]|uniref:hypothetical protein n=1 Tax=Oceanobacillus jeddahense TaxID=1462527 RepID=UPI000693CF81|nr:hypothetical protein [Oceanobacillus jeddahense]